MVEFILSQMSVIGNGNPYGWEALFGTSLVYPTR